jgi:TusA-related sulfurtransferase
MAISGVIVMTTTIFSVDKEIDARGSFCPGPLLELIRGIKSVAAGNIVALLSSDPGSSKDIPLWIAKAGYELLATEVETGYTRFVVRKTR